MLRKTYFESKFKENRGNPAKRRKIIKNVTSSKDSVLPDEVIAGDRLVSSEPDEVCNAMSEPFTTVGAQLSRTTTAFDVDVPLRL